MEKLFFKIKKNNEGVSLVEVLVTIAMILIIAGPLINSFLNAKSVNSNARVIQNGTIVAQDVAEEFEALPLEQLCVVYKDKMDKKAMEDNPGTYVFKDIEVEGANGESFYVDITLDPSTYSATGGDKNQLNNVAVPGMSSLYSSNSIMLYKHYVAADENLKELFGTKLDATTLNNLYNSAYRRNLSKETEIRVNCSYNSTTKKYDYDIKMTMTYSYKKSATDIVKAQEVRAIDDVIYTAEQEHNIYLVCPIFDLLTTDTTYGVCHATDKINILYNYTGSDDAKKDVNFYLAQQDAKNLSHTTRSQKMKLENITFNSLSLEFYNESATNFKLYTNIEGSGTSIKGLTETGKDSGIALYEMNVKVKHKDKVVAEFTSAK